MLHEFSMRIPVAKWLLGRGLSPVCEVGSLWNCDLVGVRFEEKPVRLVEMVAVELKRDDVAGVLRQCARHLARPVTEVWAAMLPGVAMKHRDRFAAVGCGLLIVDGDGVSQIVAPKRFDDCDLTPWKRAMRRRRNEHQWRMKHKDMLRVDSQ